MAHKHKHHRTVETMEKRSQKQETARRERVGERQASTHTPPQGGGYLEIYTFSELPIRSSEKNRAASPPEKDPRLNQLREIGLNHIWQEVATAIGYDNFIKMWGILDSHEEIRRPDGGILTTLRAFRAQKRYQRDRFGVLIKNSFGNCVSVKRLSEQLGEKVGSSHISRAADRIKINK